MKAAKLGIEDVTISDRISHLPEDLLLRILSLIPISDAMNYSLLSTRWKSLWKMMPTLEYDEKSCPNIGSLGFDEFCRRSMQLHEAPVLQTLTLKLRREHHWGSPKFPSSFPNTVFQKLVVLKLHTIGCLDFDDSPPGRNISGKSPVCFQSLKSLHLTRVWFRGKESFCRLISACPVVEDFFFDSVTTSTSLSFFTISVPSLQRFEIKDSSIHRYSSHDSGFKINAPSLKYLKLNINNFLGRFEFYEDVSPNLVEASLGVDPCHTDKFLRFLTPVEFLSIHLYATKVLLLADKIYQRLLHLELWIYGKMSCNLLLHLLKNSPKLQVLKLGEIYWKIEWPTSRNKLCRVREFKDPPPSICKPSSVPECLSYSLKTFEWRSYKGAEEEKEIVLYILQKARCLKTATISVYAKGRRFRKKELLRIKELESVPKASTSCQLVIRLTNTD